MATYKKRGFKGKVKPNRLEEIENKSTTANVFKSLDDGSSKTQAWVEKNQNKILPENNTILRYYGVGAQILKELKIKNMILVSRSKKRIIALRGYGINIKKQEIIK